MMTDENRKILERINAYAENTLGEIDPQKVQVSVQLEQLKPVLKEIADEKGISLEDMFILYMDLASEAGVEAEAKFQEEMNEGGNHFSQMANRLQ